MRPSETQKNRWSTGDEHLVEIPSRDHARLLIEGYDPASNDQKEEKQRILDFIDRHLNILDRDCMPGHLTASALVVDSSGKRGLLHLHRKLGRWLQLGGHCDGDGNLPHPAWREAVEESGIVGLTIDPRIVDVDIHKIPSHGDVPKHLHLDVRFIAHAPEGAVPVICDESDDLRWYRRDELRDIDTDHSVLRLFQRSHGMEFS